MSFSNFYAEIISPDLRAVAQHWNEARGIGLMPAWTDISPMQIAPQLPIIWSYTYDSKNDSFTGGIADEHISSVFGKNIRGAPMSELYPNKDFPDLFARSKRVIMEPALFRGYGTVFQHLGRVMTGERITMPFAPAGTMAGGIFGATAYPCVIGEARPGLALEKEIETWFGLPRRC